MSTVVRWLKTVSYTHLDVYKRQGFDDTTLKFATNPFYTTEKKSDTGQHLGLGLNICKILCERHNGNIILSNGIETGASVTVRFGMIE